MLANVLQGLRENASQIVAGQEWQALILARCGEFDFCAGSLAPFHHHARYLSGYARFLGLGPQFVNHLSDLLGGALADTLDVLCLGFRCRGVGLLLEDMRLEGQTVKLFTWTKDNTAAGIVYDERGYARVQIFFGKAAAVSFNEVMLKKGYARVDPKFLPDDLKHFYGLEKEAREKGLGIWKAR